MGRREDSKLWDAVERRDPSADGMFVYAVQSTRIFCRPSCPSRRPARTRVEFFATPEEARARGYRDCRRCHPGRADCGSDLRLQRIWRAEETQELVDETRARAAPTLERVKRGVEKGVEEFREATPATPDAPDAGGEPALPPRPRRGKE